MSQTRRYSRARRGDGVWRFAAVVGVAFYVAPVVAQTVKYDQFKRPAGFDTAKQAAVQSDLAAGNAPAPKDLQDYFVSKFADMTNPAKDKDIHKTRADVKKLLQSAGNAATTAGHDQANAFLLKHLPRLITGAKPNLHPAVRYNLALLLADLDSVERKGQTNPTPLPQALPELLKLLANSKLSDSIRLAALIGVSRHAALSADAAGKGQIATGVVAFLEELDKSDPVSPPAAEPAVAAANATSTEAPAAAEDKPKPAGAPVRKQAVKHWLETRAMEALGATESPTPEVVMALQTRLIDVNRPIWVRSAAALALGKLKYEPGAQLDMAALLTGFKSLLEAAVDQGATRRELREVIYSVRRGIQGFSDPAPNALVTLMDEAQKSESTQMMNAMSEMAEACESKDHPSEARVAIAVKEILKKWHDGEFSSTLDADAAKNLSEDQSSGDGESEEEAPSEDGFEFDPTAE